MADHPLRDQGQTDGHDRRDCLGDRGDGKADRGEEHDLDVLTAGDAHREDDDADEDRGRGETKPDGDRFDGKDPSGQEGPRGALKTLEITPSVLLHYEKSRLWRGYIPERFPKVTLE